MHSVQMLLEVIQAWPPLVWTRAVCSKTHVHHLGTALRFLVVYTLLMTSEVIDSSEPFFARAIRLIAYEKLAMTGLVFPANVSLLQSPPTKKSKNIPLIRRTFTNPRARSMITPHRCVMHRRRPDKFGRIRGPGAEVRIASGLRRILMWARLNTIARSDDRLCRTAGSSITRVGRVVVVHILAAIFGGFAIVMLRVAAVLVGYGHAHMRNRRGRNTSDQQRIPSILIACSGV
jgi:hypothetical protein